VTKAAHNHSTVTLTIFIIILKKQQSTSGTNKPMVSVAWALKKFAGTICVEKAYVGKYQACMGPQ